jgi:predicted NAD/FAD-dependent oxidoreductase
MTVSRRLDKDSAIAVIGAGVSGLSFASTMVERGFRRVVVLERAPRVGGKSYTVSIDGRPHDLGATMGVPIDYQRVLDFSERAGIATTAFPSEQHFDLATGQPRPLNPWREIPAVLSQVARYLVLHAFRWRGADGSGLHRAPAELYQPWSAVVERHGLAEANRRTLVYRTGYGYGFDDEVPGVLHANLIRPTTLLGLTVGRSLMWQGGTQPIWEALAGTLDVRTGTAVERIERHADGVAITSRSEAGAVTEPYDAVVLATNPRDLLGVLDASDEERAWFSQIQSYPYATFACQVAGLTPGVASVGYLDENMARDRAGHPMAWVKRYPDQDVCVFHLFAPDALSDDEITGRIAADVGRLGGRLERLRAAQRWSFFPHFPCAFMQRGGLSAIERWQGSNRTYLVGEVLSYATMARVAEHATGLANRLHRESEAARRQALLRASRTRALRGVDRAARRLLRGSA